MSVSSSVDATPADDKSGLEGTQHFLADHPSIVAFGRLGWVAKGAVYMLVGALALAIALGWQQGEASSDDEASQAGAIARIADAPFGATVLVVAAIGLLLYAAWRLVTVVLPADNSVKAWASRMGYLVSALVYTVLAWSAISYVSARGSPADAQGGSTEDSKVEGFTREVLSLTGGRWLVAILALAVVGVGGYFVSKGLRRPFDDQLNGRGIGPLSSGHVVVMGRVGWVGRGVMVVLVGFFLIRAAWLFDPQEAQGFDGTLRQTLESTGGTLVVVFVALGLFVYGAYCVVSAPLRRLAPADE